MEPAPAGNEFEIYRSLSGYEERFNASQAEVKKLASAWMLVTFSAFAFIVRGELSADKMLIDSAPLLAVIAVASNVGLVSLWIVDQLVYQRLISAVFKIGLELERRNAGWPPIRSLMWVDSKSRGMARHHALFYAAPILLNCTVAIYALVAMSGGRGTAVVISCLISIGLLLVVLREWIPRRGLEGSLEAKSEEIEDVVRRWRSGR